MRYKSYHRNRVINARQVISILYEFSTGYNLNKKCKNAFSIRLATR